MLLRVAGGYRFHSHPDLAAYVERFVLEGQSARLSAPPWRRWPSSPTSSRSPGPRSRPSAGVNVDGVMRTLHQRGYVDEVARDPGPGQAVLFGTTPTFLERLGLDSLDDLPAAGRLRARRRGGRGPRAGPAPARRRPDGRPRPGPDAGGR